MAVVIGGTLNAKAGALQIFNGSVWGGGVAGPAITAFALNAETGALSVTVSDAGSLFYSVAEHATTPSAAAVEAGTGAEVSGELTVAAGPQSFDIDLTDVTTDVDRRIALVLKVGAAYSAVSLSTAFQIEDVAFDPVTLFASGEQGFYADVGLDTCFADTAGTTPATVDGLVARFADQSGRGNHLIQATEASRPTLRQDGALYYLDFGSGKLLRTDGDIAPSLGVDKAQMFIGVRRTLTDFRSVMNFGTLTVNGCIAIRHATSGRWNVFSRGTVDSSANSTDDSYTPPITNVVTNIADIAGDSLILRVNGVEAANSAGDQGTGNYLARRLNLGGSDFATQFFSGRIYSATLRFGATPSAGVISDMEAHVAAKTGVTL